MFQGGQAHISSQIWQDLQHCKQQLLVPAICEEVHEALGHYLTGNPCQPLKQQWRAYAGQGDYQGYTIPSQ